jgi:hypothetical protein
MDRSRNTHAEEECIWISVKKPQRKSPLGRHTRRWEDNIKMDLRETGWCDMDGILEYLHNWRLLKKDSAAWSQSIC